MEKILKAFWRLDKLNNYWVQGLPLASCWVPGPGEEDPNKGHGWGRGLANYP